MASVTEAIKESLVGTTTPESVSEGSRAEFLKYAKQADDGEYYMTEQKFINAIAPSSEDYVRACIPISPLHINVLTFTPYAS